MRRAVVAVVAVLVLLVVAVVVVRAGAGDAGDGRVPGGARPSPAATLSEDDPGWDCVTMGNRSCGPSLGVGA